MRIKNILSVIAFVVAFGFSVTLAGLPQNNFYSRYAAHQTRYNVAVLLQQDVDNGYLRDKKISYFDARAKRAGSSLDIASFADATNEYFAASSQLDTDKLPADFCAAWNEHMAAWQAQTDYLNDRKESGVKYRVNGAEIVQYSFNQDDADTYRRQNEEINRTWYKVLNMGAKYGAFVDEY